MNGEADALPGIGVEIGIRGREGRSFCRRRLAKAVDIVMAVTLGMVDADRPTMVVKVDPNTTAVAIVDRGELLLLRTFDHPGRTEIQAQELADAIHPSIVFFEDNYGAKVTSIRIAGMANVNGIASALEAETGIRTESVADLDLELAGVAGAFR